MCSPIFKTVSQFSFIYSWWRDDNCLLCCGVAGWSSSATWEVFFGESRTGLLLLDSQLGPAALHAITQGHPQIGLLLQRHALPSLLDVGEGRLGQSLGGIGADRDGAAHQALSEHTRRRGAEHCELDGGRRQIRLIEVERGESIEQTDADEMRGSCRVARLSEGRWVEVFSVSSRKRPIGK